MIGYLEGQIIDKSPNQILVKVGGVGYRIFIPLSTFYALPEPPATVALQIHTRLQEDALHLYGFNTLEEKEMFLQLMVRQLLGVEMVDQHAADALAVGLCHLFHSRWPAALP
jgi:Holliday junction resolvasome RuvABC DNA-binding subunit